MLYSSCLLGSILSSSHEKLRISHNILIPSKEPLFISQFKQPANPQYFCLMLFTVVLATAFCLLCNIVITNALLLVGQNTENNIKKIRKKTLARSCYYSQLSDTICVAYVTTSIILISGSILRPLLLTMSVLRIIFMPKDKFQLKQRRKSQVCVESDNGALFFQRQSVRNRINWIEKYRSSI
jgi:hypothetical protein